MNMIYRTIYVTIKAHPGESAHQVAGRLFGAPASSVNCERTYHKMWNMMRQGLLTRKPDMGPRGGYGWFVKE
jgi:hypothetical protein